MTLAESLTANKTATALLLAFRASIKVGTLVTVRGLTGTFRVSNPTHSGAWCYRQHGGHDRGAARCFGRDRMYPAPT